MGEAIGKLKEYNECDFNKLRFHSGMLVCSARNAGQMYPRLLETMLQRGEEITLHGHEAIELRPVMLQFQRPLECLVAQPGREINPFYLMADILWMLSGRSDAEFIMYFNGYLDRYVDHGGYFHGAYGERMRRWGRSHRLFESIGRGSKIYTMKNGIDQIRNVIRKLRTDRHTQEAVLSLWNPAFDWLRAKDYPSDSMVNFKIRDDKLHMTVTSCSSEINWELMNTGVVHFGMLLGMILSCLEGLSLGSYTHQIDSLYSSAGSGNSKLAGQPEFPLYDHVEPLVFEHYHPERTLELREIDLALLGATEIITDAIGFAGDGRIIDLWDSPRSVNNKAIWKVPIVTEFTHLLLAYIALKQERYDEMIETLDRAVASDWKSMACAYLYSTLKNGKLLTPNLRYQMGSQLLQFNEEVAQYVRGE